MICKQNKMHKIQNKLLKFVIMIIELYRIYNVNKIIIIL